MTGSAFGSDRSEFPHRGRIIFATLMMSVLGVFLLTFVPWSDWRTGLLLNFAENSLLLTYFLKTKDPLIPRLCLFGITTGVVELAADAWLVDYTGTLDYSIGGGPMLWRSPIWMPLAWQMVVVQLGYIGLRLRDWSLRWGALLTGVLGAVNIPYYEETAVRINWWRYSGCRMISNTPYYIIVGEFLIAASLAYLASACRSASWLRSVFAGIIAGLGIFVAYVIGYVVTDVLW